MHVSFDVSLLMLCMQSGEHYSIGSHLCVEFYRRFVRELDTESLAVSSADYKVRSSCVVEVIHTAVQQEHSKALN